MVEQDQAAKEKASVFKKKTEAEGIGLERRLLCIRAVDLSESC